MPKGLSQEVSLESAEGHSGIEPQAWPCQPEFAEANTQETAFLLAARNWHAVQRQATYLRLSALLI